MSLRAPKARSLFVVCGFSIKCTFHRVARTHLNKTAYRTCNGRTNKWTDIRTDGQMDGLDRPTHSITFFIVSRWGVLGLSGVLGVWGLNEKLPNPLIPQTPQGIWVIRVMNLEKVTKIAHIPQSPKTPLSKGLGDLSNLGVSHQAPKPPDCPNRRNVILCNGYPL